ncbi:3' exoribonuclease family, domain 1-domain-containing protein [Flagelloscypha sp. PMI_526]|nr:3' exoribonuclease family, domain 1-domain-containing protein [Flagelloscypha sp. PMI_526]
MADRRRNVGPEQTFPPVYDSTKQVAKRTRNPSDIRPIFLQPGLINQANGSAYIETENTKIACSVYGPRQSKSTTYNEKGRLNVEVKFTPFSCEKRRAPMRDAEDRSVGVSIHQALLSSVRLELLPKSTIDIFLVIIEADGIQGCVASGITAASCALADAGIEMFGLVVACTAALRDNTIYLDPTVDDMESADGTLLLSCMPALGTITSTSMSGRMDPNRAIECMDLCQEKCMDIHSVVAQALLEETSDSSP